MASKVRLLVPLLLVLHVVPEAAGSSVPASASAGTAVVATVVRKLAHPAHTDMAAVGTRMALEEHLVDLACSAVMVALQHCSRCHLEQSLTCH